MHRLLSRPHGAIDTANVTVEDADVLLGISGIFHAAFPDFDPLDEQPQQLRCQLIDGGILLRFLNECFHVRRRRP